MISLQAQDKRNRFSTSDSAVKFIAIFMNRLSAKGTDEVMKRGAAFAVFLLYNRSGVFGTLQSPWR